MFSVVILTLNEERDLPACLASASASDDIVVLDSGSTDRTIEIAHAAGARTFTRPFDNFGRQRNYAQDHIPFRHPWVFHLDADELLTPELVAECDRQSARTDLDGFYVAPRMLWRGQWLRRCTDYPAYQARFVRAPQFRFIQVGHGQREAPEMRMERLRENYLHELASGGEAEWLEKHRRYAHSEARAHLATAAGAIGWRPIFSGPTLARRRALKQLSYRLPFRPSLRFLYQYVLRGGFLDGPAAFRYCQLLARYEGFAVEELRKLRQAAT
ncbi:MAG: glycosyltransferase family 2 protein [Verrucomicrobiota bacterium]